MRSAEGGSVLLVVFRLTGSFPQVWWYYYRKTYRRFNYRLAYQSAREKIGCPYQSARGKRTKVPVENFTCSQAGESF